MNLTRKDWSLGWTPSNDSVNGDPRGLLRADNLELDERGILSLTNAARVAGYDPTGPSRRQNPDPRKTLDATFAYSGQIVQIYSKYIGNYKYRFVVTDNGYVYCNGFRIVGGENFTQVGFTSVLGQILICAGNKRLKDDGNTIRQLGLKKPDNAPIKIDTIIQEVLLGTIPSNWFSDVGNSMTTPLTVSTFNYYSLYAMPNGGKQTKSYGAYASYWQNYDLNTIGGNPATDNDIFSIFVGATNALNDIDITVEFHLKNINNESPWTEYYTYTWHNPESIGVSSDPLITDHYALLGGTTLKVKRSDFQRIGTHPNLDWKDVEYIFISFDQDGTGIYNFNDLKFTCQFLTGQSYYYATQNVANLGTYVAKSPLSDKSVVIEPIGGQIRILVDNPFIGDDTDPQINEVWLFRRASTVQDVIPIDSAPILDTWYRVGVLNPLVSLEFQDTMTDEDALELNIKTSVTLISVKDIKEEIIGIVSGYYDRTLYLTSKYVYISEQLNPDSVDSINILKFEGGEISQNLWIVKSSLGVILIGTTQEIFEISGTMVDMPDGSIDLTVKPLGISYPPLSYEVEVYSNSVYYMAKDGLRIIAPGGQSDILTSPSLDLLFQDESRYGISPINIKPKHIERYPIAVTQTHIFISLPFTDNSRNVIDLNLSTKTFTYRTTSPQSFFVEEDGTILAGYGYNGDVGNYLREFNVGKKYDDTVGQVVRFWTVFDDNTQPRNRKDVFTLKVTADSGDKPLSIWIAKDGDSINDIYLGDYYFNGITEQLIVLAGVILPGKSYQLKIGGFDLDVCKIYNFTIEYNPFPEQLNAYRIPNDNLGTFARKRFTNHAFVIDTLGNSVNYTPIVDGVSLSGSSVNFTGKRTFVHYFKSETIGTDIGGFLSGNTFEFYGLNLEEIVSEKLPTPVKFLIIPATDYGEPNRKRHSSYKFQINTRGYQVRFTPRLDGVDKTSLDFSTSEKLTVEYFFDSDTIAIDIGGTLESLTDKEFEFYGVIKPQDIEILPPRLKYFLIPPNNYGQPNRKRHSSFKFQINTNGFNVTFTPILDGINGSPLVINTPSKQTVEYFFTSDTIAIEMGGSLVGTSEFEFYGVIVPQEVELLPARLNFFLIPPNDYGEPNRKRFSSFKFQINTNGLPVVFTPIIDGVNQTPSTHITSGKKTVEHFFESDTTGIDIGGSLSGNIFEFYGVVKPQQIELLPPRLHYFLIPPNDYGKPNRKRHSSYKFQINTNGVNVRFTPIIDGVSKTPLDFNTISKQTVEYFFTSDTFGIDIGGSLLSLTGEEFEFYGVITPQDIEVLPPRLKEFRIPESNYGIASRKRIRTMPLELNTNGYDVTFTPIVDGVMGTPSTLNSLSRQTLFHYFESDVFGVDFSGELVGIQPFEFYGLLKPEGVEVLPVAKKLDQIGPIRFDKLAKLLTCRFRVITQGNENLILNFYDEESTILSTPIHTQTIVTTANLDDIYEFNFPKTIKGSTIRVVIGPSILPFHRYDIQLKVNLSGMESEPKWIKVK